MPVCDVVMLSCWSGDYARTETADGLVTRNQLTAFKDKTEALEITDSNLIRYVYLKSTLD